MKILHAADLHIGRRSSSASRHQGDRRHACAGAWSRIVDFAIAEEVDLVTLGGDVVDRSNRFLEAVGPLEAGLRRLTGAGVEVVVVGGNHDFDVLPALVDSIGSSGVRMLGRGGRWERTLLRRGEQRLAVDGWSFPGGAFPESPLASYQPPGSDERVLVLLHADLDQPRSRYAPIMRAELDRHSDREFLLGHVHARRSEMGGGRGRFLYPGSPQAMDAGEPGPHGVCLLELSDEGTRHRWIPTSTVRYETVEVSLAELGAVEEVDARVAAVIRNALLEIVPDCGPLETVRFRTRLVGASEYPREIMVRLRELAADLDLPVEGVSGSIDSVEFDIRPTHDLEGIAAGLGAPAVVARLLSEREIDPTLAADVRRIVGEIHGSRAFLEITGGEEDLAELDRLAFQELRLAATVLLDELIRQKAVIDG